MNDGTSNTTPLSNANTTDGTTFSTLWKYPMAVRLKIKTQMPLEYSGKAGYRYPGSRSCRVEKSPTIDFGKNTNATVTASPHTTAVMIARRSVALTLTF